MSAGHKLSKSDKIDKEQEAKDKELLNNPKLSMHFKVGTFIIQHDKGRGEILRVLTCKCSKRETVLQVRWDDGTISLTKPFALNR
jgi:hypothetical protein